MGRTSQCSTQDTKINATIRDTNFEKYKQEFRVDPLVLNMKSTQRVAQSQEDSTKRSTKHLCMFTKFNIKTLALKRNWYIHTSMYLMSHEASLSFIISIGYIRKEQWQTWGEGGGRG